MKSNSLPEIPLAGHSHMPGIEVREDFLKHSLSLGYYFDPYLTTMISWEVK